MSNAVFETLAVGATALQLAAVLWALLRRALAPVLVINLLFAGGTLVVLGPQLPTEITYLLSGAPTELLDYKVTIGCVTELIVLLCSALAFRGAIAAKIVAGVGFAWNFALTLLVLLFALTFEFKCCGYL